MNTEYHNELLGHIRDEIGNNVTSDDEIMSRGLELILAALKCEQDGAHFAFLSESEAAIINVLTTLTKETE